MFSINLKLSAWGIIIAWSIFHLLCKIIIQNFKSSDTVSYHYRHFDNTSQSFDQYFTYTFYLYLRSPDAYFDRVFGQWICILHHRSMQFGDSAWSRNTILGVRFRSRHGWTDNIRPHERSDFWKLLCLGHEWTFPKHERTWDHLLLETMELVSYCTFPCFFFIVCELIFFGQQGTFIILVF